MSFLSIKEKIKTMLSVITIDGTAAIGQVADYPTQDFQSYPAAAVATIGNTSSYETTNENDELYTFAIYLYQNIDGLFDRVKSREVIEKLCDAVRDTFDSDEFLNGISLPTGRTMLGVRPTVSQIFETEGGKMCVAEIEIACRISKTV